MQVKSKKIIAALLTLCGWGANTALAVPPYIGVKQPEGPTCHVNPEALKFNVARLQRFAPGYATPITAKTNKILLIRVDFSDQTMAASKTSVDTFGSLVRSFYLENSYSLMTLDFTVTDGGSGGQGAYRMPRALSFYANGINSRYSQMISDATGLAIAAGVSLSSFDHIMIYHSGFGAETTGNNGDIWSAYFPDSFSAGGKTFQGATFVPELESGGVSPLGVICHEYGHQLGLPDLYNTAGGSDGASSSIVVGKWSLMDFGVYLGSPSGSNPAHFDAWSKLFLGFSSPETLTFSSGNVDRTLSAASVGRSSCFRVPIANSDVGGSNEYFLMEYRRTSGATYDNALPGQGLLIWHIDDTIASNATRLQNNNVNISSSRYGVALVNADASAPSSAPFGDSGDPWTSGSGNFSTPKSNAWNGRDSGIEVSNISGVGSTLLSLRVSNLFNNPALLSRQTSGSTVIVGGANGYVNPDKGERAILGVTPSSSGTVNIKIYSLGGDLVWEDSIGVTAGVQAYPTWNGKDSSANVVASGIYLVHFEGGGLSENRKVAIIK